jgi:hypothetical protein
MMFVLFLSTSLVNSATTRILFLFRFRFELSFSSFKIFQNDDKTRSFFSLVVDRGSENVCQVIQKVDEVFSQYKLPVYYEVRWVFNVSSLVALSQRHFFLTGECQLDKFSLSAIDISP